MTPASQADARSARRLAGGTDCLSALSDTTPWEQQWRMLIGGETRGPGATLARAALWALSGIYSAVISAYRAAYDLGLIRMTAARCRIISVGNLTVGGTGKSTTVRWLARWLRERGIPVAILSYGYRAGSDEAVTVVSDTRRVLVPSSVSGDEARMLAEGLPGVPVLIGKRRQLSAAHAVDRFGVRACVLDDAFQYWRLVKDLDIVLVDARCPWGGGFLLPRGLLRESPRQLRRADVVMITNGHELSHSALAALRSQLHHLNSRAIVAEARHVPSGLRLLSGQWCEKRRNTHCHPLSAEGSPLAGCHVLALSSLGNPSGFEQMLSELGATVVSARFPDHHHYRLEELTLVVGRAREADCAAIVTTDKDAVKLDPSWTGDFPVWVLSVELKFETGEDELLACLDAVVA